MCRIAHVPYRWLKVRAMLPAISWPSLSATQHPFLPRACRRCTVRTHPREYKQVAYSQKLDAQPPEMTSNLEQVLFVESGFGCDQHGQNATKACVRACRNAIEFNSIPSIEKLVPGGRNGLKLNIKIGTPFPNTVDLQEVRKVFPYGQTNFEHVLQPAS
ncbi:hypothetical protein ABBQ38_006789 [Trebouxia sp. C0009 RCD-2024]